MKCNAIRFNGKLCGHDLFKEGLCVNHYRQSITGIIKTQVKACTMCAGTVRGKRAVCKDCRIKIQMAKKEPRYKVCKSEDCSNEFRVWSSQQYCDPCRRQRLWGKNGHK